MIGRFYSNDPIGFRDVHSFNRYAYANNNPYKYIDPNGEFAVPWHGGITFFAAWSSGHSFGESLSIAYRAMQADWEAGSQGSSPVHAPDTLWNVLTLVPEKLDYYMHNSLMGPWLMEI